MLAEYGMIGHGVESRGVEFAEAGVCVLAMEASLIAINPK